MVLIRAHDTFHDFGHVTLEYYIVQDIFLLVSDSPVQLRFNDLNWA
jgi:hypothetical protein